MRAVLLSLLVLLVLAMPASAEDRTLITSQPEALTVFLNGIVFARDTVRVPEGGTARVVLPDTIFQDTLVVRGPEGRLPAYRVSRPDGQLVLDLDAPAGEVTLEYLGGGMSWQPVYTMDFPARDSGEVRLAFFAEVRNEAFDLDGVALQLAAGRVDTSGPLSTVSTVTANQYIAGYEERAAGPALGAGAVTIQHVYAMADVALARGETLYAALLDRPLPARRLLLWNAATDLQPAVIYKVRNESDLALAEGIVRAYQDGLFVGSDLVEFTPPASEGSVTVGGLADVRVRRDETVTLQPDAPDDADMLHEVTLTMSNFSGQDVALEIVDIFPEWASAFVFSTEAARDGGNLLRWTLAIPAGETAELRYEYRTPG